MCDRLEYIASMRRLSILPLLLALPACLTDGPEDAAAHIDTCSTALALQHDALDVALTDPPQCVTDEDCVELTLAVHCDEVDIGDCPTAVHRVVAERYDARAVNDRICKAVRGAELGCNVFLSCVAAGPVVCTSGECTHASAGR